MVTSPWSCLPVSKYLQLKLPELGLAFPYLITVCAFLFRELQHFILNTHKLQVSPPSYDKDFHSLVAHFGRGLVALSGLVTRYSVPNPFIGSVPCYVWTVTARRP